MRGGGQALKEREQETTPYWQHDVLIGDGVIGGERTAIRMKLHTSTEQYRGREHLEPQIRPSGERVYVQAKPYILVPDIRLDIGIYARPGGSGAIGEVLSFEWLGMQHPDIGQAQAWIYPADHTIVLWECYLFESYQSARDPSKDRTLATIWTGYEQRLLEQAPTATRMLTPAWEDIYNIKGQWVGFLDAQGYSPLSRSASVKWVE